MPSLNRRFFMQLASFSAAALALPLRAEQTTPILLPANLCGSFGFINSKGALAVPARYNAVLPFATDYAAVHRDDKWGYIDRSGKEVLAPQYEEAQLPLELLPGSAWEINGISFVRMERTPFLRALTWLGVSRTRVPESR